MNVEMPKSQRHRLPRQSTRMFSGFMSLCITSLRWQCATALTSCRVSVLQRARRRGHSIMLRRVSRIRGMTSTSRALPRWNARSGMMFGWPCSVRRIFISVSSSLSSSSSARLKTTLIATRFKADKTAQFLFRNRIAWAVNAFLCTSHRRGMRDFLFIFSLFTV